MYMASTTFWSCIWLSCVIWTIATNQHMLVTVNENGNTSKVEVTTARQPHDLYKWIIGTLMAFLLNVIIASLSFHISDSSNLCSIHLINDGITVSGNSIKVEFAGVGEFRNFRYNLDSVGYHLCKLNQCRKRYRFTISFR